MGKRAAVVFTCLALFIFQYAQPPQSFYAIASPQFTASPVGVQPRMQPPRMVSDRVVDFDWTIGRWNYDTPFTQEDVQRRVIERIFRKDAPKPALDDPSKDVALQAAAKEVRDIASTFGKAEGEFADKWVSKVMATEDPKARLEILDECFIDLELDCQGLEKALRNFRMLLAPHTALVKEARKEVVFQAAKHDGAKQAFVQQWMAKLEKGERAEDPADVLDECLVATSMGGPRSQDCFLFEEALRNYKAAAELWTKEANPEQPLGNRLAGVLPLKVKQQTSRAQQQ